MTVCRPGVGRTFAVFRRMSRADGSVDVYFVLLAEPDSPWRLRQNIEQILLNPQIHRDAFDSSMVRLKVKQVPMANALPWEQPYLAQARQVAERATQLMRAQRLDELLHWPG